ncbi:NAD(P)-binding protein [Streptomyces sp. NPDC057474]|uniref:NAD(P)-binding protein n=1 Tax=Streptomyces sp. NPDC057474 TaxID=3346144 RepID=UPI00368E78F6
MVGAGSAGCALARRLVDAGRTVLLIEMGDRDDNPAIHAPGACGSCGTPHRTTRTPPNPSGTPPEPRCSGRAARSSAAPAPSTA